MTGGGIYVGGLAGFSGGSITSSYATGSVTDSASYVGGLAGWSSGSITSSYWNTETTGRPTSSGGTGLTSAQMKSADNYSSWDTTSVWYLNGGQTAPLLRSFLTPLTVSATSVTKVYDGAAGTVTGATYTPASGAYDSSKVAGSLAWNGSGGAGAYGLTGLYASSQQGYLISYDSGSTLTIQPKALTITANNASKTVGAPNPAFSATYSGLATGDTAASLIGTLQYYTLATRSSGAGTYAISPYWQTSGNYSISYVNGTLTVTAPFNFYGPRPFSLPGSSGGVLGAVLAASGITLGNPLGAPMTVPLPGLYLTVLGTGINLDGI